MQEYIIVNYSVKIKNLSYRYPDGKSVLKNIQLRIAENECIGVVGANGAGKSTLLNHLNGILLSNNKITIAQKLLNKRSARSIRKIIGVVFQNPDDQLFSATVFDDIAFGPLNLGLSEKEVKDRVQTALQAVGMNGYAETSPFHLSFGQKKRISIATVLSMNPSILVLDEPTSNLDPAGRRLIADILKHQKMTRIIATHDLELVLEICTRVAVIHHGRIVKVGKPRTLLKNKKLMCDCNLEVPHSLRYKHHHD